jgi:hypothetical protein
MNGLIKLSSEEKYEMLEDAKDASRGKAFQAARGTAQESSLDDYIDFLSENMKWAKVNATKRISTNFKL